MPTPHPYLMGIRSLLLPLRSQLDVKQTGSALHSHSPCVFSARCFLSPMFPQPDVPWDLCSLNPMFLQHYVPSARYFFRLPSARTMNLILTFVTSRWDLSNFCIIVISIRLYRILPHLTKLLQSYRASGTVKPQFYIKKEKSDNIWALCCHVHSFHLLGIFTADID